MWWQGTHFHLTIVAASVLSPDHGQLHCLRCDACWKLLCGNSIYASRSSSNHSIQTHLHAALEALASQTALPAKCSTHRPGGSGAARSGGDQQHHGAPGRTARARQGAVLCFVLRAVLCCAVSCCALVCLCVQAVQQLT